MKFKIPRPIKAVWDIILNISFVVVPIAVVFIFLVFVALWFKYVGLAWGMGIPLGILALCMANSFGADLRRGFNRDK